MKRSWLDNMEDSLAAMKIMRDCNSLQHDNNNDDDFNCMEDYDSPCSILSRAIDAIMLNIKERK